MKTLSEIQARIASEAIENDALEFKKELSTKKGRENPWLQGKNDIGGSAKENILKEVIAFANTKGGELILGVDESKEDNKPAHAIGSSPISRCQLLAQKLHQISDSLIEPRIDGLEVVGIPVDNQDNGFVIFDVPRSPEAPHRFTDNNIVYIRKGHRSEPASMKEIQALSLKRHREAYEGLWTVRFGDHDMNWINGGVVVLEAGKIFGGDSTFFYTGSFDVFGDDFIAGLRIRHHHGKTETAWGDHSKDFNIDATGHLNGDSIKGNVSRTEYRSGKFWLTRIAHHP